MTIPNPTVESTTDPLARAAADWLAVGVWEGEFPTEPDAATGGLVGRVAAAGDVTGKHLELVPLYAPSGIAAGRLLLVGLGRRDAATRLRLHEAGAAAARFVTGKPLGTLAADPPAGADGLHAFGVGLTQGCVGPGLRKTAPSRYCPGRLLFVLPADAGFDPGPVVARIQAEARGMWLARNLVNSPPADLYPETFAAVAAEQAAAVGVTAEVWDENRLEAERMGAILAVARGSDRPPRLVVLRYSGNPGGPTLAFVGKGVTFDSGGLSLKTSDNMIDMKCDMAGAASVLGGVRAAAELKLPVNLLGVLALVENMPSGKAMKLGDVLTTRAGKTIEVLNTDAEGRLILADALAYAAEQRPIGIVDFATLTGACVVALGPFVSGLMTNNDPWGDAVLAAAARAGERAWKLPMDPHYDDMIRSKVADMRNTGGSRYGGAITAAKLLQQFVGDVPWAHLDIAGPAWAERDNAVRTSGGTGCFVRTLVELAGQYGRG
jgi:leucyl aminopeptidase